MMLLVIKYINWAAFNSLHKCVPLKRQVFVEDKFL